MSGGVTAEQLPSVVPEALDLARKWVAMTYRDHKNHDLMCRAVLEMYEALCDRRRIAMGNLVAEVEQRTAERVAEMLDERRRDIESSLRNAYADDKADYADGRIQAFTDAAALVRSGAWRLP